MKLGPKQLFTFAAAATMLGASIAATQARDVPYVPTPQSVVEEMLKLAEIDNNDVLYDLGSGDGRIVITAAKKYGTRGVGVDIDPVRIQESNANAKAAGVTDKVKFIQGDLFQQDLRPATAVTLYLLPSINLKLRPKLLAELKPGTPIVSHAFDMGDWKPEKTVQVDGSTVYLWHVPAKVAGTWQYETSTARGSEQHTLKLTQDVQSIRGTVAIQGASFPVEGTVSGARVSFTVKRGTRAEHYEANLINDRLVDVALAYEQPTTLSLLQQ
jgi:hypothetical protein